jgi:hypothetical protein
MIAPLAAINRAGFVTQSRNNIEEQVLPPSAMPFNRATFLMKDMNFQTFSSPFSRR